MLVRLFACAAIALVLTASASAAPSLSIQAPGSYTPGTPFACTVVLSGAESLFSYNAELVLASGSGAAGTDFYFQSATVAAAPRYLFSGENTDGFAYNTLGPANVRLTLGDFLTDNFLGVTTTAGQNDLIATVQVATSASQTGPLTLSFDAAGLELDTFDAGPISGFAGLTSSLAPAVVAPEPASLTLALAGLAATWFGRRRRRA
jgi:hypothetical protein